MPFQTFALLDTLKHVEIAGHQQCGSLEIFHLRWPAGEVQRQATPSPTDNKIQNLSILKQASVIKRREAPIPSGLGQFLW